MPSTQQAKEIAKELTIKAIEKLPLPTKASSGPDYDRYTQEICKLYTAIAKAVDEA